MDAITDTLAQQLVQSLRQTPSYTRLIIGIAGSPASGKSSFAHRLVRTVQNLLLEPQSSEVLLVGLDGWHLTRAALDGMPDPALAHEKRGSHWTFDADGYVAFVKALREPLSRSNPITAPTFSHALKDPEFDAIRVEPHHRLIVIEGLYPFLSIEPWVQAAELLDERWFIRVDEDEAKRRIVHRHVDTGICSTAEEALQRAVGNDMPNGQFIMENMLEPTRFIDSINDTVMAHELDG
ncbi:PRK domain-containing protein [Mycena kentingensis (nom. inval.)]|nr:PRK domain-containing protein [Mycena kentingensis (nom. inval.)]